MTRRWRVFLLVVLTLVMAGVYGVFIATPAGPRSLRAFEPDRTAELEVEMWKAYYAGRNVRLFSHLVTLNHEQYKYTWARASQVGFYQARAASTFSRISDNYDQVLPDLEHAYSIVKNWTQSSFDPAAVARAELAWWVARRVPGQDSPEQVGGLIADLNAMLFNVPRERVLAASVLRARAGRLRDEAGERADWAEVGRLLRESYRALHAAVQ